MAASQNNYPKLHNAAWPGIVGKGAPDSEPIIALDTLLKLTRDARGPNGEKFDGIDLFVTAPHFDIDSDAGAVRKMSDHIASYGLKVGSFVAPIWGGAGGGSAMGDADDRKRFLTQVRKASKIGQQMREIGIRPTGGIRVDSSTGVEAWDKDPEGNTVECYLDTPFHVPQPHGDPLDLDRSDAEIVRETEAVCRRDPGFMMRADYVRQMKREMA